MNTLFLLTTERSPKEVKICPTYSLQTYRAIRKEKQAIGKNITVNIHQKIQKGWNYLNTKIVNRLRINFSKKYKYENV